MERAFEFNVCPAAPGIILKFIFTNNIRLIRIMPDKRSTYVYPTNYKASGIDEETNRATAIRPVTCSVQRSGNEEYDLVQAADQTCDSYAHQVFLSMFPYLNANHV